METDEGVSLWPAFATRTLTGALEALIAVGDLERARSLAHRLDEHAGAIAVPSAAAAAARCRALMLVQDGDLAAARASIKEALAAHARVREPCELGRTYLTQGSIERRAKQKTAARAALVQAETIFAELGARLWLERAQRELARTGLTRSFDREFVSVKTVETNLSRVYGKLGIRSRTELAARLSARA